MNALEFMESISDIDAKLIQSSVDFLQEDSMKKHKYEKGGRTVSKFILAAAIVASIVGVTAFAAETFPSIFSQLKREYAEAANQLSDFPEAQKACQEEADLYERAAAVNETFEAEYVPLPELDKSQIVIGETYYDGPNFMIAYRLDQTAVPAQFGYGPDSEGFDDMYQGAFFCEHHCNAFEDYLERGCWPQEVYDQHVGYAKEYEEKYGIEFIHHYSTLNAIWTMERYLSEDELLRAMKELKENGHVGVIMRGMHIGDGILVEGEDRLTPNRNGQLYDEEVTEYGRVIYCNIFQEILPEEYRGRDTLTLSLPVRASNQYVYIDKETGGWSKGEAAGEILVPVTLTRTPKN